MAQASQQQPTVYASGSQVARSDDGARLAAIIGSLKAQNLEVLNGRLVPAEDCQAVTAVLGAEEGRLPLDEAVKAATILVGSFRKSDANDPDTFITQLAKLLMAFPMSVISRALDPLHGLPAAHKWLPSLQEIGAYCQAIVNERRAALYLAKKTIEAHERRRKEAEDFSLRSPPPPDAVERVNKIVSDVTNSLRTAGQ